MPVADFGRELDRVCDNIEDSDEILNRNKDLILDYKQDRVLDGLSEATLLETRNGSRKWLSKLTSPLMRWINGT